MAMTLEEIYSILESKIYYEKESMRKFSFVDNSIHIDRRAFIPFSIYKENENFFLETDTPITAEKELRIEIENVSADLIDFYGKSSGKKLLTLES
jgi:hypothetical protein